jgi:hypothetical protein
VCLRHAAPFDASRGWIYHDRYQFRIPSRFIANHTNGHGNPLQVSSEAHQRRTPGWLGSRIHRVLTPPVCGAAQADGSTRSARWLMQWGISPHVDCNPYAPDDERRLRRHGDAFRWRQSLPPTTALPSAARLSAVG